MLVSFSFVLGFQTVYGQQFVSMDEAKIILEDKIQQDYIGKDISTIVSDHESVARQRFDLYTLVYEAIYIKQYATVSETVENAWNSLENKGEMVNPSDPSEPNFALKQELVDFLTR